MLLTVASSAYMPTMQAGEVYARQQTKNRKIKKVALALIICGSTSIGLLSLFLYRNKIGAITIC